MQNMDDGIYDITTGSAECLPTWLDICFNKLQCVIICTGDDKRWFLLLQGLHPFLQILFYFLLKTRSIKSIPNSHQLHSTDHKNPVSSNMYQVIPSPLLQATKEHETDRHVWVDQISRCWKCCHCCQESFETEQQFALYWQRGRIPNLQCTLNWNFKTVPDLDIALVYPSDTY